ncbi:type VII secretion integral membrane protein EccD [Streptomyces sp. ISID311]|uniref:type VII secretion integral membrane protein EccD n=1 Tax=Streptomyces sp. ISID311 TaxID=2601673 RepID=UPI0011BD33A2|nr:type VII secretion integral membrane protein EccD [Streptomyces sp. ISID311]TXC99882.1 type VII secretion integral membrane protein EccD [Streptomyces sp. ISID311]
MTDNAVAGLCRLTVHAPTRAIDLAVPADVPIADLLPTLLRYSDEKLEEEGLDHGGWVLQRLGGIPLNEEHTLETLDLKDGEVLYLRPRAEALPEVRLDDLTDGIATVMRDRLHGWRPEMSSRLLHTLVVLALLLGLGILAWPGGSTGVRAATAGAAGLLLLAGSASASRAVGDAAGGAVLGFMAAPFLAVAGWLLPGGEISGPLAYHVLGARLLAAGAAGAGGAVLALAVSAVFTPVFVASAVVALAGAIAGALMSLVDVPSDDALTVVAALMVIFGGFVPALSFKLAGMRMPALPSNPGELQEDIESINESEVVARTELSSGWMTALYAATGAVCAGSLAALAWRPNLAEGLTAGVLSLLLMMHGRGLVNVWQRLVLLIPGAWGAALLILEAAATLTPTERPVLVAGLLSLAALLAIASWTVPGRRMLPYWGRAAEILQLTLAIGLLPLTAWVLGAFGALRAISG